MNLRWLLGNFTDPQYELSRREQFRLSNEAHKRFVSTSAFLWRSLLILAPLLVCLKLLQSLMGWLGVAGQGLPYAISLAVLLLLFWPWSAWMYRSLYVRPIRRAMRDAGYDLCIGCGYELRGLDTSIVRCPECGIERDGSRETQSSARPPDSERH